MAVVCTWKRLTVSQCISLGYSAEDVCVENPAGSGDTLYWDYTDCSGINLMRTLSQHLFIFCVFFYFSS